ncbi:MAG: citramalate synthase [Treponema sp.]|nr:citramalate synthase [Treponema sp.]
MTDKTLANGLDTGVSADIEVFDTTLRDGAQGEDIVFSVSDKLAVAEALDELGVAWIEAGNPGSNPKDMEFFRLAPNLKLKNAKLCAFGATRKKNSKASDDPNLHSLLDAKTEGVVIFGKSWDLHVTEVLKAELAENIAMIAETVAFLKAQGRTVIYDAEHFFDGWIANPAYAISTVKAAMDAGADRIVLCDTNGGIFPDTITAGVKAVQAELQGKSLPPADGNGSGFSSFIQSAWKRTPLLGIHAHNDSGVAIANSIAAVQAGCVHVQGTLVGFGERCGNTALAALVPSLELKLGLRCLPQGNLARVSELTRRVAEIANVSVDAGMPYVGTHAFSHKGGMHADGVLKVRRSFEHIDPASVGNERHILLSEVGGRSAVAERVSKIDPSITRENPAIAALTEKMKSLEAQGWSFEGADASFEILVRREMGKYKPLFDIVAYRVMTEHPSGETLDCSHAWVKVLVGDQYEIAAAEGNGPVGALDSALRRALSHFFPNLAKMRLEDYKVRVIDGKDATAAQVRVLIESTDGRRNWNTVGVSADIINASRIALTDSIEYKLICDREG